MAKGHNDWQLSQLMLSPDCPLPGHLLDGWRHVTSSWWRHRVEDAYGWRPDIHVRSTDDDDDVGGRGGADGGGKIHEKSPGSF